MRERFYVGHKAGQRSVFKSATDRAATIYERALLMGFTKKEAGLCAVASDLAKMLRERGSIQDAFVQSFGYPSRESVPMSDRERIQKAYTTWLVVVEAW